LLEQQPARKSRENQEKRGEMLNKRNVKICQRVKQQQPPPFLRLVGVVLALNYEVNNACVVYVYLCLCVCDPCGGGWGQWGRGWRNVIVGVSNNQELGYFGTFLRSAKEENSGKFINFLAYKM